MVSLALVGPPLSLIAGDVGAVGRRAEAQDLGVVADGEIELVFAGREEDGVAGGSELVVLLGEVNLVDFLLHGRREHGGIEDENVGSKIRVGMASCREGRDREHSSEEKVAIHGQCYQEGRFVSAGLEAGATLV